MQSFRDFIKFLHIYGTKMSRKVLSAEARTDNRGKNMNSTPISKGVPDAQNAAQFQFTFGSTNSVCIATVDLTSGAEFVTVPNWYYFQQDCSKATFYEAPVGVELNVMMSPTNLTVSSVTGTMELTLLINVPGDTLTGTFNETSNLGGVTLTIKNVKTGKEQTLKNHGQINIPV